MRFQTVFQRKPLTIERQFSQNVTVFMLGTACFLTSFWSKIGQNVRFKADFQRKPLIIERQFFSKRNGFYDR